MAMVNLGKQLRDKVLDEYCVSDRHEGGCCQNIIAMIQKRCIHFRRQYTYLLLEAFVPVLFVLIGLLILQVSLLFDSPARIISTKMYPLPQQILMNEEPVMRNVTVIDLLPDKTLINQTATEN